MKSESPTEQKEKRLNSPTKIPNREPDLVPIRVKKLSEFSTARRVYDIITGALL
jgi:hypothetical protein